MRIEKLQQEFNLDVRWSVFPLHPNTPEEGLSLFDLFAGQLDVESMLVRLKNVADELGLPFGERTHTYNSRRAQELGKWAEEAGQGKAFHQLVYQAYFVDGKNISRPEVLAELVGKIGLDPEKAKQVLVNGRYASAVNADWQRAGELGVTAVPTAVFQDRQLVGFHQYEAFRKLVDD